MPVVSIKSGHLFEKRLVEQYITAHHKCPVTGEPLETDDLVAVKSTLPIYLLILYNIIVSNGHRQTTTSILLIDSGVTHSISVRMGQVNAGVL